MTRRPVSIPHLVFGLIFLGACLLWAIGVGTDADSSGLAAMAPAVLIGAGLIGLVGIVVNARRHDVPGTAEYADTDHTYTDTDHTDAADTVVVHREEAP